MLGLVGEGGVAERNEGGWLKFRRDDAGFEHPERLGGSQS
jgi:hypothetical protein